MFSLIASLGLLSALVTFASAIASTNGLTWQCPTGGYSELDAYGNSCGSYDTVSNTPLTGVFAVVRYSQAPNSYQSDESCSDSNTLYGLYCEYGQSADFDDGCQYCTGGGQPDSVYYSDGNCPSPALTPTGGFTRRQMRARDTIFDDLIYQCPKITTTTSSTNSNFLKSERAYKGSPSSNGVASYTCVYNTPDYPDLRCYYDANGGYDTANTGSDTDEVATPNACPVSLCNGSPKRKRSDILLAERQFNPKRRN